MSKFNRALSNFMSIKAERLNEILNIPEALYFTDEDRDEIMTWSRPKARCVWKKMKRNVAKRKTSGIHYEVCSYCVLYNFEKFKRISCRGCGYGVRHGLCGSKSQPNDYIKIMNAFDSAEENPMRFFTDSYYMAIIRNIEKDLNIYWWMLV